VTQIISVRIVNLVTPKAGAKHELLFNEPFSGSLFLCINRAACDHACLVLFDIKTKDPHRKNQLAKQLPVFLVILCLGRLFGSWPFFLVINAGVKSNLILYFVLRNMCKSY